MRLNSLPAYCVPEWSADVTVREAQLAAQYIRRADDHGNCAASALALTLLRPQLFVDFSFDPVDCPPLRIFGVPPPTHLLTWDFSPQSGRGPDNFRGNIIEGLSMHLQRCMGDSVAASEAHASLQDVWTMFRIRVDLAARILQLEAPVPGCLIAKAALQVSDIILTP